MGRRALRKLNPTLDLSPYYAEIEDLTDECTISDFFTQQQPLEIEVGSGKGLFMQTASVDHPERNFLGIEIARKYAKHCASRLARQEQANAFMLQGDALGFISKHIADNSVAAIHVYFPDPWWKARHRKRRVMNEPFVKDITRCLIPNGILHFWTDVKEYFDVTLELLEGFPELRGPNAVEEKTAEHDLDYRTHFERRMRKNDIPVYRSQFIFS